MKISRLTKIWAFVFLILVLPVAGWVYAMLYSFGSVGVLGTGFTLSHWRVVLGQPSVWKSLGLSFLVAGISILLSVGIGLAVARNRKMNTGSLPFWMYLPLGLSPLMAAFFTLQLFGDRGILSRIFFSICPNGSFPILINDPLHVGVIFAQVVLTAPIFTFLLLRAYSEIPFSSYRQLGQSLGATKRQIYFRIELPLLWNYIKTTVLLYFVILMGHFEIPFLLGRQSPFMFSVLIYNKFNRFSLQDLSKAYVAVSIFILVIVTIFSFFFYGIKNRK